MDRNVKFPFQLDNNSKYGKKLSKSIKIRTVYRMCTDVRKVESKRKCGCVLVCKNGEKVEWENG